MDLVQQHKESIENQPLSISRRSWLWAFAFLLSMSMMGLNFPLGYIFVLIIVINRYVKDRYDFIIQITLLCGRYSLIGEEDLPVKLEDLALMVSILALFIYRKPPMLKKITIAMVLYFVALFLIASTSEEAMVVQIRRMRNYMMIIYLFVPLLAFADRKFEIHELFKKLFAYTLIICAFYALDGFVINGYVLVPNSYLPEGNLPSTYYSIQWREFPRKYPPGLYIMTLCLIPLIKYYRLNWKQWALVILALAATRTMSVIIGLLFAYGCFQGHFKKMLKYAIVAVVLMVMLYNIDSALGGFLRVQSTFDQFVSLDVAQDEEDMSEFGSGRFAQIFPKYEVLYDLDREWLGFGFLHPELTKNPKFMIYNELYVDKTNSWEVVTGIEIAPLQTIADIGYIGLAIQLLFYGYLYYIVRRLKYSIWFLSVLVVNFLFGLGGFAGFNQNDGLLLCALTLAATLLANKNNSNYIESSSNS